MEIIQCSSFIFLWKWKSPVMDRSYHLFACIRNIDQRGNCIKTEKKSRYQTLSFEFFELVTYMCSYFQTLIILKDDGMQIRQRTVAFRNVLFESVIIQIKLYRMLTPCSIESTTKTRKELKGNVYSRQKLINWFLHLQFSLILMKRTGLLTMRFFSFFFILSSSIHLCLYTSCSLTFSVFFHSSTFPFSLSSLFSAFIMFEFSFRFIIRFYFLGSFNVALFAFLFFFTVFSYLYIQ